MAADAGAADLPETVSYTHLDVYKRQAQIAAELEISHVSYDLQKWKGILASVCENFTNKKRSYVPVGTVLKKRSIKELVEKVKEIGCFPDFKNMILLDALINNEDRHYGNFGFLKDNSTNQYLGLAPLFEDVYKRQPWSCAAAAAASAISRKR